MARTCVINYIREEEKKHSVRFKEVDRLTGTVPGNMDPSPDEILGTIYVRNQFALNAKRLVVTVEVVE